MLYEELVILVILIILYNVIIWTALQMIDGELTEKILKPTGGGDEAENSRMMRQVFTLGELAQGGNSIDFTSNLCSY